SLTALGSLKSSPLCVMALPSKARSIGCFTQCVDVDDVGRIRVLQTLLGDEIFQNEIFRPAGGTKAEDRRLVAVTLDRGLARQAFSRLPSRPATSHHGISSGED